MQALEATGRKIYGDKRVALDHVPRWESGERKVMLYPVESLMDDLQLDQKCDQSGLKAADPFALAALNGEDSSLADTRQNATHWRDTDGKWCSLSFSNFHDEGRVIVLRYNHVWCHNWNVGCIQK